MPLNVTKDGDYVIIEFQKITPTTNGKDTFSFRLLQSQATFLLKRLSHTLNYRVLLVRPFVIFRMESSSVVSVVLNEGNNQADYYIPVDVFEAYLTVLRGQKASKISKKTLINEVSRILIKKNKRYASDLSQFIHDDEFNWEEFFGSRGLYYTYFRVPLLVLEELNVINLKKGKYIDIIDTNKEVFENIPKGKK